MRARGWFLNDAGIVYSTQEHVRGKGWPMVVRTVGGWFNDYLKGYSGLGVVFSYLQILMEYINELLKVGPLNMIELIGWLGLPIFTIFSVIPSLILLDYTHEHRIKYIRRVAGGWELQRALGYN